MKRHDYSIFSKEIPNFGLASLIPDVTHVTKYTIKIFMGKGGRDGDTFKIPPPVKNFCFTHPLLIWFRRYLLMTPLHPPPHFKHLSLLFPQPIHQPCSRIKILLIHQGLFSTLVASANNSYSPNIKQPVTSKIENVCHLINCKNVASSKQDFTLE